LKLIFTQSKKKQITI